MKPNTLWVVVSCCALMIDCSVSQPDQEQQKKNVWSAARDYYKKNAPVPIIYRGMRESHNPLRLAYEIPTNANDIHLQRVPDLMDLPHLLLQQQKSRFRHQQEAFGSKISEPIRAYIANDYAFCDSLNNLTNQSEQTFMHVNKSGFQQYPSHVGLYKKADNSELNYICGASWINDLYLLTAASCLKDLKTSDIVAQFNEWNAFTKSTTPGNIQMPRTFKRLIESIIKFPEYSLESDNHDLALLELKPLTEYNEGASSIISACQFNDRRSLHAKSCWLPHRNVTVTEYADIEDLTFHQETRLSMINQQVRLFVNDQACQERTSLSGFSNLFPNMLCSSDANIRHDKNKDTHLPVDAGSGIYCYEGGYRSLVSMVTPRKINGINSVSPGFLDLNFYKPWIISITTRYTS